MQEQLGAELQKQIKTMTEREEELTQMYEKKSEELKQAEMELGTQRSQTEEKEKQLREAEVQISSVEKQKAELETAVQDMNKEAEVNINIFYSVVWIVEDILSS